MTKHVICARALVIKEDKLLLVSNDGSYWYTPGGHADSKEDLKACAKREAFEETGYRVHIKDIVYVSEFYDRKIDSHKVECFFRASLSDDTIIIIENWQDHDHSVTMRRFFTLQEMQERNDIMPPYLKEGKWLMPNDNDIYQGYEAV